jgi:serine/threonine protein kinase
LKLLSKLGCGQFGDVFKGMWRYTEVAVKVIRVIEAEKEKILKVAKNELNILW